MLQILLVTLPFFLLVMLGYAVARGRLLPLESIPGLNVLVMYFALPAMLYRFAAGTPILRLLDWGVAAVYLTCAFAMVGVTIATTRRGAVGWNDVSFGALVAAFPNSGFMGVPLLVALFGPPAAGPVIVCLALDMVVTSSLCIALSRLDAARGAGTLRSVSLALRGMVVNPLPWAIALGCLSAATGLVPPRPAMVAVKMLADAASPVALVTLGAMLARNRMPTGAGVGTAEAMTPRRDPWWVVFFKLVLHPALVWAIGRVAIAAGVPLDPFSLMVLVLAAALPSASNVPILAERFGADAGRIAGIVFLTTVLSFLSFPAAVALLK